MSDRVPPNGGKGQDPPAARHLRLVRPDTPKAPKARPHPAPTFTPEEQARLRAALRNARALFGTWACLADAMYRRSKQIEVAANGGAVSADTAVRLARALGKPLEALLRPPSDASTCAACGARRGP